MPGVTVDGNDVLAVHAAVQEAVARARKGDGPTLIEALTYRWGDHSMRANLPRYRTEAEEVEWRKLDADRPLRAQARDRARLHARRRWTRYAPRSKPSSPRPRSSPSRAPSRPSQDLENAVYAPHYQPPEPKPAAGARAELRRGHQGGAGAGDGARPARVRAGRGRGQDRRHLRGDPRADREVRAGARARHADLGGRDRRLRRRSGDHRDASGGRGADLRLRHAHDGHDRESGGQVPLHAGRQADRAAGDPRAAGRRHPARRAALAEPGGVVHARARPGRARRPPRPTRPRAC